MTRVACDILFCSVHAVARFCVHAVARFGIDRFPSYARIKEESRSHS